MIEREIVDDVDTPGCSQLYPTGETNFAMLCANGGMSVFEISSEGEFIARSKTVKFNDIDNNPLFIKNAMSDGIAYFPTFKGDIQPIALKHGNAKILEKWPLVSKEERIKNWRPGGWQIICGADVDGNIYVLMQGKGVEGSHKDGGSEVWVFDPKTKTKLRSIILKEWGTSIAVTRGKRPFLTVINGKADMDVYDGRTGLHLRMIGGGATHAAMLIHPVL